MTDAFAQRINARLNLLWCHDLAVGRNRDSFRSALWNVDRVIVLSEFMKRQYEQVHELDADAVWVSRNGVDLELFSEVEKEGIRRDRNRLVFASRPERGLDVLLRDVMPAALARNPDLKLYIAGYGNRAPEWQTFYATCEALADRLGDRVVRVGHLAKRDLYRLYFSAGACVYPTPSPEFAGFREVSCITAMECQAAGLPMVSTATGALPETLAPGAGVLLDAPRCGKWQADSVDGFVGALDRLIRDDGAWEMASALGRDRARSLDWSDVCRDWLEQFERLIRSGNRSPARLVRHFWRTSDIVCAKEVLAREEARSQPTVSVPELEDLRALLAPWHFMEEPEGYRLQYEKIGAGHSDHVYDAPEELRFTLLHQWLSERADVITSVLDYGCAHGAYAIGLAQNLSHLRVHGVDIDRFSIDMASRWAQNLAVADRTSFSVCTADALPTAGPEGGLARYDCAIVQEILEHVPEPWKVLASVESQVRPGGKVYITVPYGPWEFTSYKTYPHRCHVWHFDAHDLREMIGHKLDLTIESTHAGENPLTGEPQGWWVVTYTVDPAPARPIDLDRHLWLQRPRHSVTAAIIAGPNAEETLHWSLRSLGTVVDEIVLADCGMSPEARRIADQYGVRVIAGVDPRKVGFDQTRNLTVDASRCDFCLWIDTDEKLIGGEVLEKYLRSNCYHGYALRQHHFACDAPPSRDLPVRIFRRADYKGQSVRFWGAIHEHPELAVNLGPGPNIALNDVHVAHVGYLDERTRRSKFLRNWPLTKLDQERYPDRILQKHFLVRDNMHLVRYALEANGGVVDEPIRARCRETIELYRQFFLGRGGPIARSSLEYYSEAVTVLGEGFEAAFQVEADQVRAHSNGAQRYRFASTADFNAELTRAAVEKTAHFESEAW